MRHGLLVVSLVGLTVLASTGGVHAQRRGIGIWWGGGAYYPQGGYYDPYYGSRGFGAYGNGYTPDYYYATPSYAINPGLYYAQPAAMTPPARPVQSFYSGPEEAEQAAAVTVVVPTADTQVVRKHANDPARNGASLPFPRPGAGQKLHLHNQSSLDG